MKQAFRRPPTATHRRWKRATFAAMRGDTDREKVERFMRALGDRVRTEGTIYLTGGATAVLHRWRATTIDIDLKADPEPSGFFEAIATLKDELDIHS